MVGGRRTALILAGLVGCGLAFLAAEPYPGVTVDSGEYLATADGVVSGHGLSMPYVGYDEAFRVPGPGERIPLTQFPPGYPLLLAGFHGLGLGLLDAARLLGVVCYLLTICIAGYLVWRHTRRAWTVAVSVGLLLAPDVLTIHAMAWSEPPALLLMIVALMFTLRHLSSGTRRDLVWAGVAGAAATMFRFAGIAAPLGTAIALVFSNGFQRSKVPKALVFLTGALTPLAAWFIRNAIVAGQVSDKSPAWHPPGARHLAQGARTVGGWVTPGRTPALIAGIILVAGFILWLSSRAAPRPTDIPGLCFVYGAAYAVFVLATRFLLDQNIALDTRILVPLQVFAVVGLCSLLPRMKALWIGVICLIALTSIVRGILTSIPFSESAVAGYTNDQWRSSETLRFVESLPESTAIITNAPDPLWVWQERTPFLLPPLSNLYTGQENVVYPEQLRAVRRATACRVGVVVFFDRPTRKGIRHVAPEAVAGLGLTHRQRLEDGDVYDVDEPPCRTEPPS
jgi:hypothetical protein